MLYKFLVYSHKKEKYRETNGITGNLPISKHL